MIVEVVVVPKCFRNVAGLVGCAIGYILDCSPGLTEGPASGGGVEGLGG